MKKILFLGGIFFGLLCFKVEASDVRYFCTETWFNGSGTVTKEYHCYSPESAGTCTADCMIGDGCSRTCCVDEMLPGW